MLLPCSDHYHSLCSVMGNVYDLTILVNGKVYDKLGVILLVFLDIKFGIKTEGSLVFDRERS